MNRRDLDCRRFDESLESYLDGDLEDAAAAALESHSADCAACSQELELARRVRGGLRSLPRLEAPAPAVHAVLARVRAEVDREPGWRWLLRPRPAAIAAAATIVLLIVLAVAWIQGRQPVSLVGSDDLWVANDDLWVGNDDPTIALDDPAVARATLETKLALARFADASRKVGRGLGRDQLHQRAVIPIGRSVSETLDGRTDGAGRGGSAAPERG